jgi:hypothetical protein
VRNFEKRKVQVIEIDAGICRLTKNFGRKNTGTCADICVVIELRNYELLQFLTSINTNEKA